MSADPATSDPLAPTDCHRVMHRVCVFCGSSSGARQEYAAAATRFGQVLAHRKIALVYGGGRVGLMCAVADAVLEAGGHAIGVIPDALVRREIAHGGLTELHVVASMHERKALMANLADAFVLLPGGFGSWEEFCEAVTWSHLGIHEKPCGVLNVSNYYGSLLALVSHAVAEGFVRATHQQAIVVDDDPEILLNRLARVPRVRDVKWTETL
jgi:uncharacterized protein (TIGR00730 family)